MNLQHDRSYLLAPTTVGLQHRKATGQKEDAHERECLKGLSAGVVVSVNLNG